MNRLGLSAGAFVGHMLAPGLAAAALCGAAVALWERAALTAALPEPAPASHAPLSRSERRALLGLAAAGLAGWIAPLAGYAPWFPFAAAVALTVLPRRRAGLVVPWRVVAQVGGLVVVLQALALHPPAEAMAGLPALLAIALAVGAVSALANNLPASVSVATLLTGVPAAYGASIGLAVGALATPQGSVATLIASDLAGADAPRILVRRFAPVAAAAVVLATLLLWTSL
jgi:hypothetical protein